MANSTIRSVAGIGASGSTPFNPGVNGKRAVHRLSDGTLVAVVFDSNRNDITGDGGDGTNVGKIYIYSSADGITWTLRATQNTDVVGTNAANQGIYSSCVGPDNSIHIAYISNAFNLMYVMATYAAGPAYTLGTLRTLYTVAGAKNAVRCDIDTFGTAGQLACIAAYIEGASTIDAKIFFALNGGTTLTTPTTIAVNATSAGYANSEDITLSCCKDAIAANTGTWAIIVNRTPATGSASGDVLYTGQLNTATGAVVGATNTYVVGSGTTYNQRWLLSNIGAGRDFIAMSGIPGNYGGFAATAWKFRLSATAIKTDLMSPSSNIVSPAGSGFFTKYINGDNAAGNAWFTAIYTPGTSSQKVIFLFASKTDSSGASSITNIVVDVTNNTPSWRTQGLSWTNSYTAPNGSLTSVIAGNQRNLSTTALDTLVTYNRSNSTFLARYHGLDTQLSPASVIPASGSTITTDRPTLQANYKNTYQYPQYRQNMRWELAVDSGFTTSYKVQVGSDSVVAYFTDSVNQAVVTAIKIIDAPQELYQGTWYIRASSIDEFGNYGPASAAQSFVVSHPPNAANLYPNGGQVFAYGSGTVNLDFDFTDPSPFDYLTAYRVVVENSATGVSIFDSGQVTSSNSIAPATIPAGSKDVLLRWKVYLWDSDNVQGPASAYQTFEVSDIPAPTITGPVGNLTTSIPTITWTPGLAGGKTEAAWRLQILLAGDSVYDSTWINGSITSKQIPSGLLRNANSYTFILSIRDSLGLEGSTQVIYSTAWTPPNAADLTRVYLYEFDRQGYVFIGWSGVNLAVNFTGWNLYRREVGDTSWTLLTQTTDYRNNYGYRDYTAKANTIYQYIVTQLTNVNGDIIESTFTAYTQVTTPSSQYWLLDSFGIADGIPLYNATKDSNVDTWEKSVYNILGRGRHTDRGDHLGYTGTLTIKMYDRPTASNKPSLNCFLDPSVQIHTVSNVPDYWAITGSGSYGNITYDYQTYYEPAPNRKLVNLYLRSDNLGIAGGDAINLAQTVTLVNLPVVPGGQFTNSFTFAKEPDPLNVGVLTFQSVIQYYTAANALISTETVNAAFLRQYEPVGSGDVNSGNFKSYSAVHNMPLNTDHMIVTIKIKTTTAGWTGAVFAGAYLNAGNTADYYQDGDFNSSTWTGLPYASTSYTSGYYLARNQRLDIGLLKELRRPMILRSPFGDYLQVDLDDIPFDREGGGGTSDIGEINLPYYEVAF